MATSTVEDYLKQILLEELAGGDARVATGRIAQALVVTPGTVTSMLKTLSDGGLVDYEAYGGVRLTPAGRRLALHVVRRHRLVELFLVRVMGMDWSEVHAEAEQVRFDVGLTDNYNVALAQNTLTNARLSQLSRTIAYINAVAEFERVQRFGR